MKKCIFLILLLNTSFLFGYDLRGYWGLNILTPEKIKYVNEKVSWGQGKRIIDSAKRKADIFRFLNRVSVCCLL